LICLAVPVQVRLCLLKRFDMKGNIDSGLRLTEKSMARSGLSSLESAVPEVAQLVSTHWKDLEMESRQVSFGAVPQFVAGPMERNRTCTRYTREHCLFLV